MSKSRKTLASPAPAPRRFGLYGAALAVVLLPVAYLIVTQMLNARERTATLASLPEKPALEASTRALAPALDQAIQQVNDEPTAANVGQLGKLYQANYFYDEATACYRRAMALAPADAQWPYLIAYLDDMGGRGGGSSTLLDRAIELDPGYVPARLRRADNRYKAGDHAGAAEDYTQCLERDRANTYAHFGLGRIAADARDWAAAEEHLRRTVEADSGFGTAYRLLATVYKNQGKEAEQKAALASAEPLGRYETGPDPWVDGLESLCYHTEQLLTKGDRAEKIGDFPKAQAYYGRVLAIEPDNYIGNAKLAGLLQKMRLFQEAEPYLLKALSLPPRGEIVRPADLRFNLGNNYYWQGKADLAIQHYEEALQANPLIEAAYHGLAGCYLQLKQPAQVIVQCEKVLALFPESHAAHFNWGQALMMIGDHEGALKHYAEAARLEPSYPPANFMVGQFLMQQQDRTGATPYLEKALADANATGNGQLIAQIQRMLGR